MFEVSSCLGTCNVKGASEKDIALKCSCVLMVSGKLNQFSGKHQMLTVNSHDQFTKFRGWCRKRNYKWGPEVECVSILRKGTVEKGFTRFLSTVVETPEEFDRDISSLTAAISLTEHDTHITVPVLPSGKVNCGDDMIETLKSVWGHSSLKPLQKKAIDSVVTGNHTFVLMPTGEGKLLVFQLPGVCDHRPTKVVSPLIALINDQVGERNSKGIAAESLSGETDATRRQQILFQLRSSAPELKFVYSTPETLRHDVAFREVVRLLGSKDQISYLVFDEAHCISQWGHGFRPDYLSFSEESTSIVPKATVILLSPSATPDVISDVKQAIGLDDVTVVSDQFDWLNLKFEVHEKSQESAKEIISILCSGESGLVTALKNRNTKKLVLCLKQKEY